MNSDIGVVIGEWLGGNPLPYHVHHCNPVWREEVCQSTMGGILGATIRSSFCNLGI